MGGIILLGRKSCIQNIKFNIYWVSKWIPAEKSQNFVDISGAQKPTWAKFLKLKFDFFLFEETRLHRYYQNQNQLVVISSSCINLTMKQLIKSYLLAQKQSKSEISLFGGRNSISLLLQIDSSSFQASQCSKQWCRLAENQSLIYFGKSIMVA